MAEFIPFVPGIPFQSLEVVLAGVSQIIEARWNARDKAWYIDVLETDRTPIAMGLKLMLGAPLGRTCLHTFFHGRMLFAFDATDSSIEATLDDLGSRIQLAYFTELDLQIATSNPDSAR